ncbi:hypothetical protein JOD82_001850 [Paenibacillus sp. 1182]|uniref:hypothetical protein n=1 Tax=Paenibacillus sp. 1182 TaxID=2806565 RepID=UPI001AE7D93A|nr:hypothetical protein [Paenibacillus sp. 1182]MBP1308830.1 hypothetical protein [Paenibacillus sp. 1182]
MKREFKVNETIVQVEETKQKTTTIHIETADAEIYVNGVLLWQRYKDPKFAKIPPLFRAFVADRTDYVEETGDGKIAADLYMENFHTSALFFFPENARSPIHVRLPAVTLLEELKSDYIRNKTYINEELLTN